MQTSHLIGKKRKTSMWNAFLHKEVRTLNQALPAGIAHKKSSTYTHEISRKWHSMSGEEKIEATKDEIKALEEIRAMKVTVQHNVPLNVFHNAHATLANIQWELDMLWECMGTEALLVSVHQGKLRFKTPMDFVLKMEAYCVSGIEGVVTNHVKNLLALKAKTAALIMQKLNEVAHPTEILRMYYNNFGEHITICYGIVVENWPLTEFKCHSQITSRTEVEFKDWQDGEFQKRIGMMDIEADDDEDGEPTEAPQTGAQAVNTEDITSPADILPSTSPLFLLLVVILSCYTILYL
ncbi:hypothetical protein SCP_0508080 [Sparassis crispa]|uniref:Uncharacterized protein n=1 Tax=Sparassis crispa TaxID=139825 RepID=A0A401GNH6_9APHY|nr:hypothetical protein SCP_0508080 [Sparassis crispa]GBE83752.1 hypothetical protein SCP_0508080 [Sparassis crispa]